MDGTAGLTPDREVPIDSNDPAVAALAAQMFSGMIADGTIEVDDPAPAPAPVQVVQQPTPATAPAPVAQPAEPGLVSKEWVREEVAQEPEPEVTDVPTFKPKLDDDLKTLLEEPDFDEEARLEVAAELENGDPDEYEYVDQDAAAKIRALEKRNAFLESQVVAKSKKGWVEEAKRAYPDLARLMPGEIEGINASSRRAFIREADKLNTRYSQVLGPTIAKLEAAHAAISASATEVAREEVAAAWGKPAADTLPPADASKAEALKRARATGNLGESIKVLMEDTPIL